MKTFLHSLLLAVSFATAHAAPLKVVTWNLEWFPGKRPTASERNAKDHMKDARAALLKINPDVFIGIVINRVRPRGLTSSATYQNECCKNRSDRIVHPLNELKGF